MSNQPPVKTPLSKGTPATGSEGPDAGDGTEAGATTADTRETAAGTGTIDSTAPPADAASAPAPPVDALLRRLRPVAETRMHPEAESRLAQATGIEVSLDSHRLVVRQGDLVLMDAPVATGRPLSPTPEGTFTVAGKPPVPPTLRYGHFRTKTGALLLRGVFPKLDPLPPEAVFDAVTPKGWIALSGEGPVIFGGEATGAATSDGSLVVPDRIALLLHEHLPVGLPVVVAR